MNGDKCTEKGVKCNKYTEKSIKGDTYIGEVAIGYRYTYEGVKSDKLF